MKDIEGKRGLKGEPGKKGLEGKDDMTSHIKSSLLGSSVSFPINNGKPQWGIWQGIYLCEYRYNSRNRTIILTAYGE